jgi:2-C-methyl-D-erythritol 2,4-cyclodiphosphate synthase
MLLVMLRWLIVLCVLGVIARRPLEKDWPKLAPHLDRIRASLAGVLGVGMAQVSVKGKTNEGVDAVGRGEAMAVHAVVLVAERG